MTDRELLEKAAKAAGVVGFLVDSGLNTGSDATPMIWNPLTDDGDALRLAVKLALRVDTGLGTICRVLSKNGCITDEPLNSDPYAATRRAVVRAAAAIGEQL